MALWPYAGGGTAALLLGGLRYAPVIYLGTVAGQLWAGQSPGPAMVISLGSLLEALLGARLLARRSGFDTALPASRDFFRLCVVAAASPAICASSTSAIPPRRSRSRSGSSIRRRISTT